jgi:hypothetical protein
LTKKINILVAGFSAIGALLLLSVNLYGLTQEIRPAFFDVDDLRFPQVTFLTFEHTMSNIQRLPDEGEVDYATRITHLIAGRIAHIHWNEETDSSRFNQRVPVWENYILFLMGEFSGIPEYQKYHFIDYKRSLKRGIGICGDASMIASQLLSKAGIKNKIVSFPKHVVVAVELKSGEEIVIDADYGVVVPIAIEKIQQQPLQTEKYYAEAGYDKAESGGIALIYQDPSQQWNGVKHFVTKKYYFEYIAYFLKWFIPFILLLFAIFMFKRRNNFQFRKNE